ncbi:hypothetical protein JMUB7507_26670 [Staphylococcus aureus]
MQKEMNHKIIKLLQWQATLALTVRTIKLQILKELKRLERFSLKLVMELGGVT